MNMTVPGAMWEYRKAFFNLLRLDKMPDVARQDRRRERLLNCCHGRCRFLSMS